jgi:glycosyltransferase involved in cell wall biosynthesis
VRHLGEVRLSPQSANDVTRGPTPTLSVVIACYKDGPAIPHMYERLTKVLATLAVKREIVFVNDGSPDDSEEILRTLARRDPEVVVINHTRNFGSQAAFTSGMKLATGDMVVLMDGDLQDPPELIPGLFEKWQAGYQVVYGVRVKRDATWFLQIAYKLFYRLFRALSYVDVPRDAGDFSLMDRAVVDAINSMSERDRFVRGLRAWVGFKQTGVPYVRPERMFGVTTNSLRKNIAWARKGIFSFSFVPLEIIFYLALGVTGLAGLMLVVYVVLYLMIPTAPSGFMTLLTLILGIGGIQLLCLAVIGDYVARVLEEVKQRPHFLIKSVLNPPPRRAGGDVDSAPVATGAAPARAGRGER